MSTQSRRAHRGRRVIGASAMCLATVLGALALPVAAWCAASPRSERALPVVSPAYAPTRSRSRAVVRRSRATAAGSCSRVAPRRTGHARRVPHRPHDRRDDRAVARSRDVRSGDTIMPVISSDGCVVVVQTQLALDLFRDDDNDERWDVYRLVVPECGGQADTWELVSASAANRHGP